MNAKDLTSPLTSTAAQRNPKRWLILIVLCLATLVLVIDNMVLTVALPEIAIDLHAGPQSLQWVIDCYILVFAGLLLTTGSLSDRFGRRLVMVLGLVLFGAASLIAAYATSAGMLISGRVIMGIGGALIMPSTLSILITVFDEAERPRAIGAWTGVSVLGLVGGPVLGGVLLNHFWWGSVFLLNVPVAALAIAAAFGLMPESKGPARPIDLLGMALSIVGTVALVWSIIEFPSKGISGTWVSIVIAVAFLLAFAIRELKAEHPMVPLQLFGNRVFTGSSFSLVLATFATAGLNLLLTQYLQFVLGYSPIKTALAFTPLAVAGLLFNGLGAWLVPKLGARPLTLIGMVILAAGSAALAALSADSGFWAAALAMALLGSGAGLAMPAAIGALMGAIPPEQAGVGSALNDTIQQTGGALGVAILGAILAGTYTARMPSDVPAAARDSIASAVSTGDAPLLTVAREAFSNAMSTTFIASGVAVLLATVIAFFLMKGAKTAPPEGVPEAEADPGLVDTR